VVEEHPYPNRILQVLTRYLGPGVTSKLDVRTKVTWVLQAKDEAQVSDIFSPCQMP